MSAAIVHDSGPIRLATRGSRQALAQSTAVAEAVTSATGRVVELVLIETTGDVRVDVPLHEIGGQGVFVKEVQRAVLDGRADIAVHSAKDLPSAPADGLDLVAFTQRRTPADALVGCTLEGLSIGATVATGSVRRRAQLSSVRPDLEFVELRGNIDSRLSKVPAGGAIVMAVAALEILEMTDRIAEVLPVDVFVPAVGQGCVAVECRDGDAATRSALAAIDHRPTRHDVAVERAFLAELGSGCSLPVGAHVRSGRLWTFLADLDRRTSVTDVVELSGNPPDDIGLARGRQGSTRSLGVTAALAGRRILVTRERPGELGRLLAARGAEVVHMPLIRVVAPHDGGAALRRELDRLSHYDWLVVTAAPGAERVGQAAAEARSVKLAAVGTATATVLAAGAGRPVDLVPPVQTAAALAETFNRRITSPQRVLLAVADRASGLLAEELRAAGHIVTSVEAYRTVAETPDRAAIEHADAVLFASGSAVESWVAAVGVSCPPVAVAIGPSTAAAADRLGVELSGVATDHSLDGLVTELERQFADSAAHPPPHVRPQTDRPADLPESVGLRDDR